MACIGEFRHKYAGCHKRENGTAGRPWPGELRALIPWTPFGESTRGFSSETDSDHIVEIASTSLTSAETEAQTMLACCVAS